MRDKEGTAAWHALDEPVRETTDLYVFGIGATLEDAVRDAAIKVTPLPAALALRGGEQITADDDAGPFQRRDFPSKPAAPSPGGVDEQAAFDRGFRAGLRENNGSVRPTPPEVTGALRDLLDHYTRLVNSGDAGNWNPEQEPVVIAARAALAGGK
jgi:hypothetical protein